MRVGVLESGMVGHAVASRLAELGHDVRMGSREAGMPAAEWALQEGGERASAGDYREAADFGELIVNRPPAGIATGASSAASSFPTTEQHGSCEHWV